MPLDFTNTNLLWTSILAETLARLGLRTAIICPGSRSAPLAIAFAQHPQIEAIPVLDERSASFFALGLARQQQRPVVLVCTSGTAGANFYPAVIEAAESRVPLLILTADRPPELRHCNAGQAIDQHKLYGNFPNWQTELALPSLDPTLLTYIRQTTVYAWQRAIAPSPGVVHVNVPLRDPLAPLPDAQTQAQALTFEQQTFFNCLPSPDQTAARGAIALPWEAWRATSHGIIIAGPAQPADPQRYCQAIAQLAQVLGFPVLAEGISPVRTHTDVVPQVISTYDAILRHPDLAAKLAPAVVIRIGEMPTSKQLRTWLSRTQPRQWVIDPSDRNLDPLHGKTVHLPIAVEAIAPAVTAAAPKSAYLELWQQAEQDTRQAIRQFMTETSALFEGKVAWILSQTLPPDTPFFVCSSTPVRDVEFFWQASDRHLRPFFNRGANGIDGSLSTALGIAHRQPPAVMLTGDLALLHDTNGFLLQPHFVGHLTIVLINNHGGGIFEMLPIAQFDPPFEEFFATPQTVDTAALCRAYGVEHEPIPDWNTLVERLNPLPTRGIRVLELCTDRKADARSRQAQLREFSAHITITEAHAP